jgi:hypothetical protein
MTTPSDERNPVEFAAGEFLRHTFAPGSRTTLGFIKLAQS